MKGGKKDFDKCRFFGSLIFNMLHAVEYMLDLSDENETYYANWRN